MASTVDKLSCQLHFLPNAHRCFRVPRRNWLSVRTCTKASYKCNGGISTERKPRFSPALKSSSQAECLTKGPVLVWFKNDLRIGDHPGLHQAVQDGSDVVPVYCLDPTMLRGLLDIPGGIDLLWGSLCNLEKSLKSLGSGLMLRVGSAGSEILDIAESLGASKVITEDNFDYRWQSAVADVAERVPVEKWSACIWGDSEFNENYREFQSTRGMASEPVGTVVSLPPVSSELDAQEIPSVEEIMRLLENTNPELCTNKGVDPFGKVDDQPWAEWMVQLTAGPQAALSCLRDYLLFDKTSTASENAVLRSLVEELEEECLPGLSFPALFFPAISVGLLSPREVYAEAQRFVQDSDSLWGKVLGLEGFDFPVRAAIAESDAADFHRKLAETVKLSNSSNGCERQCNAQFWDWQGLAVEFTVSQPDTIDDDTPVVVLVHGFGASSFHWRRNVESLRAAGNIVYCLTLPGFGKTQKPSLKYSQYVWRTCIKDFILTVIRQPVIIAGNSIGGYSVASVAGFHKELIQGVVLLNSAGPIVPDFTPDTKDVPEGKQNFTPPKFVIDISSKILLFYLELSARDTLRKLYPANPENADEKLISDLLRAGCDPNAASVLKSVFFLQPPTPLNYLLTEMYGGPILVVQGCLDPLNDAKGRVAQFEDTCPKVQVKLLSAGHCPHDEAPEDVNSEIIRFAASLKTSKTASP